MKVTKLLEARAGAMTARTATVGRAAAARFRIDRPARAVGTLSPEAERWLSMAVPDTAVTVTGVAGGVGTSTVTALLRSALRMWRTGDGELTVTDVGTDPWLDGAQLDDPHQVVVVVCPAHERGLGAAADAVRQIGARSADPDSARRVVVAVVATSGPGCGARRALTVAAGQVDAPVIVIPQCTAIAPGDVTSDVARLDVAGPVSALAAAVVQAARARCRLPLRAGA